MWKITKLIRRATLASSALCFSLWIEEDTIRKYSLRVVNKKEYTFFTLVRDWTASALNEFLLSREDEMKDLIHQRQRCLVKHIFVSALYGFIGSFKDVKVRQYSHNQPDESYGKDLLYNSLCKQVPFYNVNTSSTIDDIWHWFINKDKAVQGKMEKLRMGCCYGLTISFLFYQLHGLQKFHDSTFGASLVAQQLQLYTVPVIPKREGWLSSILADLSLFVFRNEMNALGIEVTEVTDPKPMSALEEDIRALPQGSYIVLYFPKSRGHAHANLLCKTRSEFICYEPNVGVMTTPLRYNSYAYRFLYIDTFDHYIVVKCSAERGLDFSHSSGKQLDTVESMVTAVWEGRTARVRPATECSASSSSSSSSSSTS